MEGERQRDGWIRGEREVAFVIKRKWRGLILTVGQINT
jgi:hypothetical protein